MSIFNRFVLVGLVAAASMVQAKPLCSGSANSVRLRLIQNAQIIIPVTINQTGPYDFLLDTGAEITTVDPRLAKALGLKMEGTVGILGVGNFARTPFAKLDSLQAGSEVVERIIAVIQDLGELRMEDSRVRGVLAGNFLERFGVLIDYRRRIVCFDRGDTMEQELKGPRVRWATEHGSKPGLQVPQTPTVTVRLSGIRNESLLLRLDSGINAPLLYPSREATHLVESRKLPLRSRGTDGADHVFAVLAAQELQIGLHTFHAIQFVMPVGLTTNIPDPDVNGLLPTALFRRVYINYTHHYAVLEP
jgi:Aspartyl protease